MMGKLIDIIRELEDELNESEGTEDEGTKDSGNKSR